MLKETNSYFGPDGHLNDNGIALYADALMLDRVDDLPANVRSHVEDCVVCQQEIAVLCEMLDENLYREAREEHPFFKTDTQPQKTDAFPYFKIAAILLSVVLAGLTYWFFANRGPEEPVIADEPIITEELIIAENFTSHPFYENLVGQEYRAGTIRVLSPSIDDEFSEQPIGFEWDRADDAPLTLQILNNRTETIHETGDLQKSYQPDIDLDPGLYYWRLESDKELLYVGRFTVR